MPTGLDENCAWIVALVSGISVAAQYLSVMPSQALVALKLIVFLSSIVDVGELLQPLLAHHADQAFMQDVEAFDLRRAVARDQPVRIKRNRVRALVGDLVLDREHVLVVDR